MKFVQPFEAGVPESDGCFTAGRICGQQHLEKVESYVDPKCKTRLVLMIVNDDDDDDDDDD